MGQSKRLVIAGAGSIGCYVGGLLAAQGLAVTLLGRERIIAALRQQGLALTDGQGLELNIPAEQLELSTEPQCLATADIILIAAKSLATADIAEQIKQYAKPEAVVLSLQNGVKNPALLRQLLDQKVLATMIPFNVVQTGPASFHRGTFTPEIGMQSDAEISGCLSGQYIDFTSEPEFEKIQWGKILLNINNAVNALSNLPLKEQLSSRPWRRLMAAVVEESMAVFDAAGIQYQSVAPVSMKAFCRIMRLPTFLFKIVAAPMLKVDPKARASMWEDLHHKRLTEVDEFQGLLIDLGKQHGVPTPLNNTLFEQVKKAEQKAQGSPGLLVTDIGGGVI